MDHSTLKAFASASLLCFLSSCVLFAAAAPTFPAQFNLTGTLYEGSSAIAISLQFDNAKLRMRMKLSTHNVTTTVVVPSDADVLYYYRNNSAGCYQKALSPGSWVDLNGLLQNASFSGNETYNNVQYEKWTSSYSVSGSGAPSYVGAAGGAVSSSSVSFNLTATHTLTFYLLVNASNAVTRIGRLLTNVTHTGNMSLTVHARGETPYVQELSPASSAVSSRLEVDQFSSASMNALTFVQDSSWGGCQEDGKLPSARRLETLFTSDLAPGIHLPFLPLSDSQFKLSGPVL